MFTKIQNDLCSSSAYITARNFATNTYHKCTTWVTNNSHQVYPKLLVVSTLAKGNTINSLNIAKAFLWQHRNIIAITTALVVAFKIIRYIWKNIPHKPIVQLDSTLNVAKFSITVPKTNRIPPNITLTFCIDTSGSMNDEDRLNSIKEAMITILDRSQKIINVTEEANISLAIIGFDHNAKIVQKAIRLTPSKIANAPNAPINIVKNKLANLVSGGTTSIIKGLDMATDELEALARANKTSSHTLILLTDGGDRVQDDAIGSIQSRLAKCQANLFAIGIGETHDKGMLKSITAKKKNGLEGEYIDTTEDKVQDKSQEAAAETPAKKVARSKARIVNSILDIYDSAIASFTNLVLTTSQLPPGTWSINNSFSTASNNNQVLSQSILGSLSEEEILSTSIYIDPKRLDKQIDLSKLEFVLSYTDPAGLKGQVVIPWNANTTINPTIVRETQRL